MSNKFSNSIRLIMTLIFSWVQIYNSATAQAFPQCISLLQSNEDARSLVQREGESPIDEHLGEGQEVEGKINSKDKPRKKKQSNVTKPKKHLEKEQAVITNIENKSEVHKMKGSSDQGLGKDSKTKVNHNSTIDSSKLRTFRLVSKPIPGDLTSSNRQEVRRWVLLLSRMFTETLFKESSDEILYLGHQLEDGSTILFEYTRDDRLNLRDGIMSTELHQNLRNYRLMNIRFIPVNIRIIADRSDYRRYPQLITDFMSLDGSTLKKDGLEFQLQHDTTSGFYSYPESKNKSGVLDAGKNRAGPEENNERDLAVNNLLSLDDGMAPNVGPLLLSDQTRDETKEIPVIPVLHGPVLESYLKLNFITALLDRPLERKFIEEESLTKLKIRGYWSRFTSAFTKRGKIIILKYLFYGMIFAGFAAYLYFGVLKNSPYLQNWTGMNFKDHQSHQVTNTDYYRFSVLYSQISPKWDISTGVRDAGATIKFSDPIHFSNAVENYKKQFGYLSSQELLHKGKVLVLAYNDSFEFLKRVKSENVTKPSKQQIKEDGFYIVANFPKTERVLISYLYMDSESQKPYWISYMTIERRNDVNLYSDILDLIKEHQSLKKEEVGVIAADTDPSDGGPNQEGDTGSDPSPINKIIDIALTPFTLIKNALDNTSGQGQDQEEVSDSPIP